MEDQECWVQCDMCQKWRAISPLKMIGVAVGWKEHKRHTAITVLACDIPVWW